MRAQHSVAAAAPARRLPAADEICAGLVVAVAAPLIQVGLAANPRVFHMAAHIYVMNALAPLLAVAAFRVGLAAGPAWRGALALATAVQIMLLYLWHAPSLASARLHMSAAPALMQLTLLLAATMFWGAILAANPWRSVAALAITGKLYCLLGVLLLFAPRVLGAAHGAGEAALADQRAAGLLMLAICPLSYVLTGVAISTREVMRA
jgi:putative membrane protein